MKALAFAIIAALIGLIVGLLIGDPLPGVALALGLVLGAAGSILVVPALRPAEPGVVGSALDPAAAGWAEFHRELARARRFEGQFVLLRFPVTGFDGPGAVAALRYELALRGRRIDRLWVDDGHILVLLPETGREAVGTVLARIRQASPILAEIEPGLAIFPEHGITSGALLAAVYGAGMADVPTPIGARRPETRPLEADGALEELASQRG
jgi:hypothetical protein